MRSPAPRTPLLSTALLAAALTLSACSGGNSVADKAPKPADKVPAAVSKAVDSDVGEFLVKPKAGTPKAQVDGVIATFKENKDVETVVLNPEGFVDVTLRPHVAKDKRADVIKQMAALGDVIEGI